MQHTTVHQYHSKPLYRVTQVLWYIINIIEIILLFRLILRLIGASTDAVFTSFVYNLAAPLVAPFQKMVPSTFVGIGVLDWNTIIAMMVYWVIGLIITQLIVMSRPVSSSEAHEQLRKEERVI